MSSAFSRGQTTRGQSTRGQTFTHHLKRRLELGDVSHNFEFSLLNGRRWATLIQLCDYIHDYLGRELFLLID